jgi:hypothetical protein
MIGESSLLHGVHGDDERMNALLLLPASKVIRTVIAPFLFVYDTVCICETFLRVH